MNSNCPICKRKAKLFTRLSRSDKKIELYSCLSCDFIFSEKDMSKSLMNNKLDSTRLKNAGMEIPSIKEDYNNGSFQAKNYFKEFINKDEKNLDILEIGSSWGYFLNVCRERGHHPIGIEINKVRKDFIENNLKIKCFYDINSLPNDNVKFDKIFLFYVIEYIQNPLYYLEKLVKLLKNNGEIIITTPNKNDVISDIWLIDSYKKFMIEEHVANYFSVKSTLNLCKHLKKTKFKVQTKQEYSFFNHLRWYFTNQPFTTGIVGGDKLPENINSQIAKGPFHNNQDLDLSKKVINLISDTDKKYKKIIEDNFSGNKIVILIKKEK